MTLLCYASGVHLTANGWKTLCGRKVKDIPTVPRSVEPLTCRVCYGIEYER